MTPKVNVDRPPKELALFDRYKRHDSVPQNIPWEELAPKQQQLCLDAYRFSGFIPGIYQGITGIQGM